MEHLHQLKPKYHQHHQHDQHHLHPPPVNNVCTVWTETTAGHADIFFSVSTDGDQIFSEPDNISESEGFSQQPQISSSTS
jgi:predicted neuraminidase